MLRIALLVLIPSIAFVLAGCGGQAANTRLIAIRSLAFDPDRRSVALGTTISWVNTDSATHSVVSGRLVAGSKPTSHVEGILDTGFTNPDITVTLGDTVVFRNLSVLQRQVEVKDRDLNVVFLSEVLQQNDTRAFTTTSPGRFDVRDLVQSSIRTTITVVGIPKPNGTFNSGTLAPGDRFRFKPLAPGDYPYFCGVHNVETGTITVSSSP